MDGNTLRSLVVPWYPDLNFFFGSVFRVEPAAEDFTHIDVETGMYRDR